MKKVPCYSLADQYRNYYLQPSSFRLPSTPSKSFNEHQGWCLLIFWSTWVNLRLSEILCAVSVFLWIFFVFHFALPELGFPCPRCCFVTYFTTSWKLHTVCSVKGPDKIHCIDSIVLRVVGIIIRALVFCAVLFSLSSVFIYNRFYSVRYIDYVDRLCILFPRFPWLLFHV